MGTFSVEIEVESAKEERSERVRALVDTGASHTVLPTSLLLKIGVEPHSQSQFQIASGQIVSRKIGRAWIRIDGHREMTVVVLGPENAPALLGAVTLEEMSLGVDPVGRKLIDVPGLLMGLSDD